MKITIDKVDDSLLEVYVIDHNDDYHKTPEQPSTELERLARKIKRRYSHIGEYMRDLALYKEYMVRLAHEYGGPELLKLNLKADQIREFVPPHPRIKNKKYLKRLLKYGIITSHTKRKKLNVEGMEDYHKRFDDTEEYVVNKRKLKDKLIKKNVIDGFDPIKDFKKRKQIEDMDYLEEYFFTKNQGVYSKKKKGKKEKLPSVTRILNGEYDDIRDTYDEDEVIYSREGSTFMTRDFVVYEDLRKVGWDSLKLMKSKSYSKKATRLLKKRQKEDKKRRKSDKKKDDFITKMFLDNDYDSFKDYEKEMLEFTSKNIFI